MVEIKHEQLQELVWLWKNNHIDLRFGDETHVCTSGYVPYGWQFGDEKVFIPSENKHRLNIFGMISYNNEYDGFDCEESITGEKLAYFLDDFSKRIIKPTVIVLDNSTIHRKGAVAKSREKWEEKGLYLFYLPPYSPHYNIIEIVWRFLKGKWLQPKHYLNKNILHEATREIISEIGDKFKINFSCVA